MSGGVPKRVKISRTQKNTFCKSGGWGQQGLILCGGQRGKQGMCNYIKKRTNLKKVLVSFEEAEEETEEIGVSGEITVQGASNTGVDGPYTYYAFKNVGSGSISFDFPTGSASNPLELEVFVVGGGGGGGGSAANAADFFESNGAGGGGGGGQVNIKTLTYTNGVTNIPITVGSGGAGGVVTSPDRVPQGTKASNGDNSSIGTIISKGGLGGTTTAAGASSNGGPNDIVSGGSSFEFNSSGSNNGGKGWLNVAAVGGGGGGTLVAGGDYANNPNPPTGPAGAGGNGVSNTSPGTPGSLVASWSTILTAIGVPAANGFGGGGGGGAASDVNSETSGGTGNDGGGDGTFAGDDGLNGGETSSKTAAATNSPINTQVLTLNAVANRGGGGGGSVSYAQKLAPTPPPTFSWPNPPKENFTPVDQSNFPGPFDVEAGGRGGSGLVIFRFLTDATTDKTITKTVTKKRGRCSDGLNK